MAKTTDVLNRLSGCGIVPVVVLDRVEDAVPTAKALLAGGVDVMEITLRTAAGLDSIREVAKHCPDMCVGAGTVLTLDQCKAVVEAGAKFIVSPGFYQPLVEWCIANDVPVTPGCVTPTEITAALALGLKVVKFFPANVYGGLSAMKALSGPFGDVKFIPTGGVDGKNLAEYIAAPFIHAVGGSWLCTKADIAAGNFDKITALSAEAQKIALGFELTHVGINCETADAAMDVSKLFDKAFGTGIKDGNSSIFAGSGVEVMKSMFLGDHGHIAIKTANMNRAIASLEKKGFEIDPETAKYKGDKMIAVYLKKHFGGFAVHLLQK
ncbi:MAG: bifunctional 4-hydroxy-2-oxoglutarate aldolase/2-dehydro-3-deoxy-phosphogluconate aldolase [Oscillospiraceae bacterium]|nr:bifunctional 4-hydroxy-2-oxoglutarate aldolase/2-dehydro-3-deoxy-phosphogluconate aldolase [Oscillospiraceae bacterium]